MLKVLSVQLKWKSEMIRIIYFPLSYSHYISGNSLNLNWAIFCSICTNLLGIRLWKKTQSASSEPAIYANPYASSFHHLSFQKIVQLRLKFYDYRKTMNGCQERNRRFYLQIYLKLMNKATGNFCSTLATFQIFKGWFSNSFVGWRVYNPFGKSICDFFPVGSNF